LGDSQDNFQLQRFTTRENIAKSFRGGYFFDARCRSDRLLALLLYMQRETIFIPVMFKRNSYSGCVGRVSVLGKPMATRDRDGFASFVTVCTLSIHGCVWRNQMMQILAAACTISARRYSAFVRRGGGVMLGRSEKRYKLTELCIFHYDYLYCLHSEVAITRAMTCDLCLHICINLAQSIYH